MNESISIDDFPPHIRERLEKAVHETETITLTAKDQPVAEFRPLNFRPHTPESLAKLFESLPHLTPEEAADFGRDLDEIRKSAGNLPFTDPWDS